MNAFNSKLSNNKGSGLGVILYGLTLLLVLIFTAINIVNSKVIENGYNSLRDAVQAASSGSVIHLLKTNRQTTNAQAQIIKGEGDSRQSYDIYLQLALGYLINRGVEEEKDDTIVQTGEINNFIKLDHQKVVNSTLALLEDAVIRRKNLDINKTEHFKIMMFFIEPYQMDDGKKFFDIIAYGNGDYKDGNISDVLATSFVRANPSDGNMKKVYNRVEREIYDIVNCNHVGLGEKADYYKTKGEFWISLNSDGTGDYDRYIREMETYPHYLIVVKDFALPTIFDGHDGEAGNTNNSGGIQSLFDKDKYESSLPAPMCALNTGKVQRQIEEAGWSHNR